MAGDKNIQAQDQAHQVQGYCAFVDDNMGDSCCVYYHQATFNGQHIMGLTGKKKQYEVIEQMIEHQNTTREIMRTQHEKVKATQKENEDYVTSQLSEIDKLIEDKEYSSALELLDALLEMSKTKFIRPKLLKQVRKKKEFVIWMSNSNGNN